MKSVILIATHRSGTSFLRNILKSFKGYSKYPILIVISDFKKSKDLPIFNKIVEAHPELPITISGIKTNSFEYGALYFAYNNTDYDEFLLLSHSCEIRNTQLFNIVFNKYKNRSVAFGIMNTDWQAALGADNENEKLILKYISSPMNKHLKRIGRVDFWQGHIGKYRRVILDKLNLAYYLPTNIIEAFSKSEILFTSSYNKLDRKTVVLFPKWVDRPIFVRKYGKIRLKIANRYIIKWKSHWKPEMIFDHIDSST